MFTYGSSKLLLISPLTHEGVFDQMAVETDPELIYTVLDSRRFICGRKLFRQTLVRLSGVGLQNTKDATP